MENRKAYHEWNITDKYSAGLILTSAEVKSLSQHRANWQQNAFVSHENGELFLRGLYFTKPVGVDNLQDFTEERVLKLLLNKKEIEKISKKINEKGFSLIPLKIFRKKRFFKVELGIGEGKKKHDKRESLKQKDIERQTKIDLKNG